LYAYGICCIWWNFSGYGSCRWCLYFLWTEHMPMPMMSLFCLNWAYVIFLRSTLPLMPLFCLNWSYVIFLRSTLPMMPLFCLNWACPILLSTTIVLYYSLLLMSYTTLYYYCPILLSTTTVLYYFLLLLSYTPPILLLTTYSYSLLPRLAFCSGCCSSHGLRCLWRNALLNIFPYWHMQYVLFSMAYAMMKSVNFAKYMLRQ
jgi:hypothetical protein